MFGHDSISEAYIMSEEYAKKLEVVPWRPAIMVLGTSL